VFSSSRADNVSQLPTEAIAHGLILFRDTGKG